VAILNQLVQRGWINENGVKNLWQDMKQFNQSVLLPSGAKMFRDKDGNIGVYGYSWDRSDLNPYTQYQLKGE
jgi:hypothetical protein